MAVSLLCFGIPHGLPIRTWARAPFWRTDMGFAYDASRIQRRYPVLNDLNVADRLIARAQGRGLTGQSLPTSIYRGGMPDGRRSSPLNSAAPRFSLDCGQ